MKRPVTAVAAAVVLAGCASDIQSADLFVVSRSGPLGTLTMLVSDGGTIRCDGASPRPLPDQLLLAARDVALTLDQDVQNGLHPSMTAGIYRFRFKLQDGTLSFADRAAAAHPDLARAEQFVLAAARGPCAGARGA